MPDDRLRDSDVCAGLGQLGDLGEDGEVVLHRLRGDEAGVDAGEAAGAMAACMEGRKMEKLKISMT